MLRKEPLAGLFSARTGRAILTEAEFCDGAGRLFRMDRVVVDPGSVAVVDWKTGGDGGTPAEHERQIGRYMALLAGLYAGRRIRGLLAYVDRCELREVG